MTTKDILNLDCREEENKVKVQRVLRQLKPLSKYSEEEDVPLTAIEKAIKIMCYKYQIRVSAIRVDIWSNKKYDIWKAEVIDDSNLSRVEMVYGISIYELLAKVAILIYSEIKKERLKVRT